MTMRFSHLAPEVKRDAVTLLDVAAGAEISEIGSHAANVRHSVAMKSQALTDVKGAMVSQIQRLHSGQTDPIATGVERRCPRGQCEKNCFF